MVFILLSSQQFSRFYGYRSSRLTDLGADNPQVDEDGGFAEFQVTLSARPNRNDGSSFAIPADNIFIRKLINIHEEQWNTPQTVRVMGLRFHDDDTVIYVDVGPEIIG